jgi:hypothetical protein
VNFLVNASELNLFSLPAIDPTKITFPLSLISGKTFSVNKTVPKKLVYKVTLATSSLQASPLKANPALFNRISIFPYFF